MSWLVILDRDGVINADREDYVKSPQECILIGGAADAIRAMNQKGWIVVIATNQSCIGKGIITPSQLDDVHAHILSQLSDQGARIDKIYVAPDHPDRATPRRKPGSGMIVEALQEFSFPPLRAVMIGDALRDLQAAHGAGCRKILVTTGQGQKTLESGIPENLQPVSVIDNLFQAVDRIEAFDGAKAHL